jgi:hypothetical protein
VVTQAIPQHQSVVSQSPSLPNILLRLEGLTAFVGAVLLYAHQGYSGVAFVLLLLLPDLSMIGYLVNPRIGSLTYNAVHFYTLPALLIALGLVGGIPMVVQLGLIWFAHIGMDRVSGYGLKYPTQFKDTHLGRV